MPRLIVLASVVLLLSPLLPLTAQESPPPPTVDLQIKAPPYSFLGKPFTLSFHVTFRGPGLAKEVRIVYPLAPGFVFRDQEGGFEHDQGRNRLLWTLRDLEPGRVVIGRVTLVGTQAGKAAPCAEILSIVTDQACPPLEVRAVPALHVSSNDEPDPVEVGDSISYVLLAENQGDADVEELVLEADIPEQMEFVSAVAPPEIPVEPSPGKVRFGPVPRLAPGQRIEFRLALKAVRPGDAVQSTRIRYRGFSREVIVEEGTTVYE